MSVYPYHCPRCGHEQEHKSRKWRRCPKCGTPLKRVYAPTPVIFKGEGFTKANKESKPKE